jgi:miniconductance mechanosensitive channel
MQEIPDLLTAWIETLGISGEFAYIIGQVLLGLIIIIVGIIANWVAKKVPLVGVHHMIRKSRTDWDDKLIETGFFKRLSHIAPALVIYFSAGLFPEVQSTIRNFAIAYMGLIGLLVFASFLDAVEKVYRKFDVSRSHPIKGYVQAVKVFVYIIGAIAIIATLMDESPWKLISGIGAMTAILLLIFKDSILGFVASIQIAANDMVQIGDWIEMPKYGADGDVVEVSIQCVKVQNWDKTITTIPTYALVSDAFKNWRGMKNAGGRRIKRSVFIDMNSIQFCSEEMLERFGRFALLSNYIADRRAEIDDFNLKYGFDPSNRVNGRRMTNIGTFRHYIREYLRNHPKVHPDMTLLVRHLPPTEHGLPIELYLFANDTRWAEYEAIQADIFDHILAVVPEFDLRVFQRPSGLDLAAAFERK